MTLGGDFDMGLESMAIEGQAKDAMGTADAAGGGHHHHPYARQVRLRWHRDEDGKWAYAKVDGHFWEVVCPQCGDTGGPLEYQVAEVRRLRGPYRSGHRAKHVASKHYKEFGPR